MRFTCNRFALEARVVTRRCLAIAALTLASMTGACKDGTTSTATSSGSSSSATSNETSEAAPTTRAAASPRTQPADRPSPTPGTARFLGLQAPIPSHWKWKPVTSRMRAANYIVSDGELSTDLVVFYFGEGMGGSVAENIDRWKGQMKGADGAAVEANVEKFDASGMPVTLVEMAGTYMGMGMSPPVPDAVFLSAIVEAPAGMVFIRLVGPAPLIEANREAYRNMLEGLSSE